MLEREGRTRRKESREPCRAMERGENITAMRTRFEREGERERELPPVIARMVNAGSLLLTAPNNLDKLVETVLFLTRPGFLLVATPDVKDTLCIFV